MPLNPAASPQQIVYKYTNQHGATCILTKQTLRFAKPSEMNDPFDIYIDDLLGMDLDEVQDHFIDRFVDTLLDDPQRCANLFGLPYDEILANAALVPDTDEERARLKQYYKSIDLSALSPEYKALRDAQPRLRDELAHYLKNCAIFCATRTSSNLLMWAHYADQHRGAVLGFLPDTARDSMLALLEPVQYQDTRPALLDEDTLMDLTMDKAAAANRRLYLTKSTAWTYEEELRLFIPGDITPGEDATYKRFFAHELVELHLGCRMTDTTKQELTQHAKTLNPNVHVFNVAMAKRAYGLEHTPIA